VAVMLFEAYMDETGTHEKAPVTGVVYLARSDQWEASEASLIPILKNFECYGISRD